MEEDISPYIRTVQTQTNSVSQSGSIVELKMLCGIHFQYEPMAA